MSLLIKTRRTTPRRLFLRGVLGATSVAVGMPLFDLMLNEHGEALAGGEEIPTRFGLWFFGNGVHAGTWTPTNVGDNWTVPDHYPLAELLPIKEYVSVVSGLNVMTPRHPHHSGMSAVNSGGPHYKVDDVRDTIVSTMKYPSVDQVAANYFQQNAPTPYRSLEAAVTLFRGTDEGTSFQYLSHNGSVGGETNVNPSEQSPHNFFDRLFNQGTAEPLILKSRASVLNAVGGQIKGLQGKLGAKDKQRLEQHLTSISELESRLKAPLAECSKPQDPTDLPDVDGHEQIAEKNTAMSQLVALSLACGLTRSFSIMYSTCGSGCVFWMADAVNGQHYTNHTEDASQPTQLKTMKFTMAQLHSFLDLLKNTPEGTGNLLDHSSILVTTEHHDGFTHSQDDMPILVCGKGGGRLKGNVHHAGGGGNVTNALLTALRGAGLPLTEFGYEAGYTNQWLPDLETG